MISYTFRVKDNGWCCDAIAVQEREKRTLYRMDDYYQKGYHNRVMMPIACEHCSYVINPRIGDISLGDAWNIGLYNSDLDPKYALYGAMQIKEYAGY